MTQKKKAFKRSDDILVSWTCNVNHELVFRKKHLSLWNQISSFFGGLIKIVSSSSSLQASVQNYITLNISLQKLRKLYYC